MWPRLKYGPECTVVRVQSEGYVNREERGKQKCKGKQGAKWGQMVPNGVKCGQTMQNGTKQGEMWQNWAKWVQMGLFGEKGTKWSKARQNKAKQGHA